MRRPPGTPALLDGRTPYGRLTGSSRHEALTVRTTNMGRAPTEDTPPRISAGPYEAGKYMCIAAPSSRR
ncbi:MAG: hypothetical protein QOJ21_120, partial [Solirubrobacteraceae bacterium]|nr:hypothetical protein [Solirubrobacteraceae bacterium]